MKMIETSDGYEVRQTMDGLDIYINGDFRCELSGKSFGSYELDETDDDAVEFDIDGETVYLDEYSLEKDIEFEMTF